MILSPALKVTSFSASISCFRSDGDSIFISLFESITSDSQASISGDFG